MSARILARHAMHRKTYGTLPTLLGADIVEPVAVAVTAPAAFAEVARLAAFDAEFDVETEDCFALFVEIIGEDL